MPAYNFFAGEATFSFKRGHTRRFKATEPLVEWELGGRDEDDVQTNPATHLGKGTLAARIFIGLNIGDELAVDEDDVIDAIIATREEQKANPSMSILTQRGIYQDSKGGRVDEPSLQIVILELSGMPKKTFVNQMLDLAEVLAEKFKQNEVIVEIQKRGVVQDTYSVTGPKPKRKRGSK